MNIKQFSDKVGVSSYTLRYYEKIGLLKGIQRNASGHRVYTDKDFDWLKFILRLKVTGMPLDKMLEYAKLRELGSRTVIERQKLLETHKIDLQAHIESQQNHLAALETKINLYKSGKVN